MLVFSIRMYCCSTENSSNDLCDMVFTVPIDPCTVAKVNDFSVGFVSESLTWIPVDNTSTKVSNNSKHFIISHPLVVYRHVFFRRFSFIT